MRRATPFLIGAVLGLSAGDAAAQSEDVLGMYADDFAQLESKFNELAAAMGADTYDWRPMEGVRSVSEVYMLIAAEAYYIPTLWGVAVPEGVPRDNRLFQEMAAITGRDEVLGHLERAFAHARASLDGLSDDALARRVQFFGRERALSEALYIMLADMHEHLGQAIAYARSNEVVPPWTARQQAGS